MEKTSSVNTVVAAALGDNDFSKLDYAVSQEQVHKQLGWNCFDVAADISREALVKYALSKSKDVTYRAMLAPEVRHAAALTVIYMNLQEASEKEDISKALEVVELMEIKEALKPTDSWYKLLIDKNISQLLETMKEDRDNFPRGCLPKDMRTPALKKMVNEYHDAHEKMRDAVKKCNDALGFSDGNRLSLGDLDKFFSDDAKRQIYLEVYGIFKVERESIFTPHEAAFYNYSMSKATYEKYIEEYYAKKGWVAFQRGVGGEQTTSIIDIAALMTESKIIIYQLENHQEYKEIYATADYGDGKNIKHIEFRNNCHFVKLVPIALDSGIYSDPEKVEIAAKAEPSLAYSSGEKKDPLSVHSTGGASKSSSESDAEYEDGDDKSKVEYPEDIESKATDDALDDASNEAGAHSDSKLEEQLSDEEFESINSDDSETLSSGNNDSMSDSGDYSDLDMPAEYCPENIGLDYVTANTGSVQYAGVTKNGMKDGHGKLVFPGGTYLGEFSADKFSGEGCYNVKGSTYRGRFEDGEPKKVFAKHFLQSCYYKGEMKKGKFHGLGKIKYDVNKNLSWCLVGLWRDGKCSEIYKDELADAVAKNTKVFLNALTKIHRDGVVELKNEVIVKSVGLLSCSKPIEIIASISAIRLENSQQLWQAYEDSKKYRSVKDNGFIVEFQKITNGAIKAHCQSLNKMKSEKFNSLLAWLKDITFTKSTLDIIEKELDAQIVEAARVIRLQVANNPLLHGIVGCLISASTKVKEQGRSFFSFSKATQKEIVDNKVQKLYLLVFFHRFISEIDFSSFSPKIDSKNKSDIDAATITFYEKQKKFIAECLINKIPKRLCLNDQYCEVFIELFISKIRLDNLGIEELDTYMASLLKHLNIFNEQPFDEWIYLELKDGKFSIIKNQIIAMIFNQAFGLKDNDRSKETIKLGSTDNHLLKETIKQCWEMHNGSIADATRLVCSVVDILKKLSVLDQLDESFISKLYKNVKEKASRTSYIGFTVRTLIEELSEGKLISQNILDKFVAYLDQNIELHRLVHDVFKCPSDAEKIISLNHLVNILLCDSTVGFKEDKHESNFVGNLHTISEFINKFRAADFSWYIQQDLYEKFVEKFPDINSLLMNPKSSHNYYISPGCVGNIRQRLSEEFKEEFKYGSIEVINRLTEILYGLITRSGNSSSNKCINHYIILLEIIGKSFASFSKQAEYPSLSKFVDDSSELFKVFNGYTLPRDKAAFERYIPQLSRYLETSRKMITMDFNQAIGKFHELNAGAIGDVKLRHYLKIYRDQIREHFKYYRDNAKSSIKNRKDEIVRLTRVYAANINQPNKKLAASHSSTATDYCIHQISLVLSGLATILVLNSFKDLVSGDLAPEMLPKPHIVQILGIMITLNMGSESAGDAIDPKISLFENHMRSVRNNLGQILTGQGKSWAIALLSGLFSLMGYEVTVSCYNKYLSERDQADFAESMRDFNFNNVKYQTLDQMCNENLAFKIQEGKAAKTLTLSQLITEVLTNTQPDGRRLLDTRPSAKSVLICDEADVLLSTKLGDSYYGVFFHWVEGLREVQLKIWNLIQTQTKPENPGNFKDARQIAYRNVERAIDENTEISGIIASFKRAVGLTLYSHHIEEMIKDAYDVHVNPEEGKYRIENGYIKYKKDDRWTRYSVIGYKNTFQYLRLLPESEAPSKDEDKFGSIMLSRGNFSYAMLAAVRSNYWAALCAAKKINYAFIKFHHLFGFSGSLELAEPEKAILRDKFGVECFWKFPSSYGRRNLRYADVRDRVIVGDVEGWVAKITSSIRYVVEQGRCVLIFVENEEQLYNLLRKLPTGTFDPRKINFVTDNEMSDIRDGYRVGKSIPINTDMLQELIGERYSGSAGHITFFTKTFGRGVDFKVANSVLTVVNSAGVNVGGAHVIQAFFSPDPKEDLQVQGRAARQTDPGSYEMILLDAKLFKKAAELNKTHAEVIDEEQNRMMQENYSNLTSKIHLAIDRSISTITFFQEHMNVSTGDRDEFLSELKGL